VPWAAVRAGARPITKPTAQIQFFTVV
jgi:hypothetical protein